MLTRLDPVIEELSTTQSRDEALDEVAVREGPSGKCKYSNRSSKP